MLDTYTISWPHSPDLSASITSLLWWVSQLGQSPFCNSQPGQGPVVPARERNNLHPWYTRNPETLWARNQTRVLIYLWLLELRLTKRIALFRNKSTSSPWNSFNRATLKIFCQGATMLLQFNTMLSSSSPLGIFCTSYTWCRTGSLLKLCIFLLDLLQS